MPPGQPGEDLLQHFAVVVACPQDDQRGPGSETRQLRRNFISSFGQQVVNPACEIGQRNRVPGFPAAHQHRVEQPPVGRIVADHAATDVFVAPPQGIPSSVLRAFR